MKYIRTIIKDDKQTAVKFVQRTAESFCAYLDDRQRLIETMIEYVDDLEKRAGTTGDEQKAYRLLLNSMSRERTVNIADLLTSIDEKNELEPAIKYCQELISIESLNQDEIIFSLVKWSVGLNDLAIEPNEILLRNKWIQNYNFLSSRNQMLEQVNLWDSVFGLEEWKHAIREEIGKENFDRLNDLVHLVSNQDLTEIH